jgi:hypothetical protein
MICHQKAPEAQRESPFAPFAFNPNIDAARASTERSAAFMPQNRASFCKPRFVLFQPGLLRRERRAPRASVSLCSSQCQSVVEFV